MVSSLAFMLVGTLAATPCENLKTVPLLKRAICPYRQSAAYKGSGDLKGAANWVCKVQ
jgi:hypothetical protein